MRNFAKIKSITIITAAEVVWTASWCSSYGENGATLPRCCDVDVGCVPMLTGFCRIKMVYMPTEQPLFPFYTLLYRLVDRKRLQKELLKSVYTNSIQVILSKIWGRGDMQNV